MARMLCDTPNKAAEKLTLAGWRAAVTPVMAVRVPDVPGGFGLAARVLGPECDVNVGYGYCMSVEGRACHRHVKVAGDEIERKLADASFAPVSAEDVYIVDPLTLHSGLSKHARAIACVRFVPPPPPCRRRRQCVRRYCAKRTSSWKKTVDARGLAVAQCPNIDAERAIVVDTERHRVFRA